MSLFDKAVIFDQTKFELLFIYRFDSVARQTVHPEIKAYSYRTIFTWGENKNKKALKNQS